MNTFGRLSYCLILRIVLFGLGTQIYVAGNEECPGKRDSKLADETFGMALTADDLWTSVTNDLRSNISVENDKFQISLDVQHFRPEEITVKTSDGYVIVEAKHEEKQDEHRYVSQKFVRRYSLPKDAVAVNIMPQLSSDGILTITAPTKVMDDKGERIVPMLKTGPVRKEPKEKGGVEGSCSTVDKSCNI